MTCPAVTYDPMLAKARSHQRGLVGELFGRVVKWALIAVGLLIMLLGVLIAPLPGPFGLPISAVGLMIVLKNSFWAKRQFIRMQYARPGWVYPVRRLIRREPEFVPVMWQGMLRMERLLLKRNGRILSNMRRGLIRTLRRIPR